MRKIAIIGANSYIARNVMHVLCKRGYQDLTLYDYAPQQIDGRDNYVQVNMMDTSSVKKLDLDCDIIFMFVGKTGSANGFDEFETFIDVNEKALLNLLNEYRRQKSSAKIVFPSTRLVYKGALGRLPEDAEKEFKTVYAINKFACEQYLEQYHNVYNVNYVIFRICVPYGTLIENATSYGTAEFMLNKAKQGMNITLYGNGSVRRTLTYMGDLCNILIDGALCEECTADVYNIGGEDYSLTEMAQLIAKKYSVDIEYVKWPEVALKIESGDTVFDDKKLKNILDVTYEMTFERWSN